MPQIRTVRRGSRTFPERTLTSSAPASASNSVGNELIQSIIAPPQPHMEVPMISNQAILAQLEQLQNQINRLKRERAYEKKSLRFTTPLTRILALAYNDPFSAVQHVKRITSRVKDKDQILIDIAKLCLTGPVGFVSERRALRVIAMLLLDTVIDRSEHILALCVKGEALLPQYHHGTNESNIPLVVLKEAISLFDRATEAGSHEGNFLRGRYLLTTEVIHKDPAQAHEGRRCVRAASDAGCSRAQLFLAHRYEYPYLDRFVSFAKDLPRGKSAQQKFILDLYKKAAASGEPDALNDIGTSYAEGYGGLPNDFDIAITYYRRALAKGSVHAFDNLGTHYETGMGGRFPKRIDYHKALYYYRQGVRMRCPKCAHNMGNAYEEGMGDTLLRDPIRAEKYYRHALRLADDANDNEITGKIFKDLIALFITRIKLLMPDDPEAERLEKEMLKYFSGDTELVNMSMEKVNRAIISGLRGKPLPLGKLIGDVNSAIVMDHVAQLDQKIKKDGNEDDKMMFSHVVGQHGILQEQQKSGMESGNKKRAKPRQQRRSSTAKRRKC